MFVLRKIVIGTFNNFCRYSWFWPKTKQRQRNLYKFPNLWKRTNCLFYPRELKYVHLLSLVCTCNPVFATCISNFANLPFWSGNMGHMHSYISNLSLVFGTHPSILQGIICLQTSVLMVELFWWLPSSTFLLPPTSPILDLLDSLMVGKGFLTEMKWNLVSFYYIQNFRILCYFHAGFYKMFQSFLRMERLEYFLKKIFFISMSELFLIPTELVFWI